MQWAIFIAFLAKTIKSAAVFIFGSTGEAITEKSGHLNMGIPGIMCMGAMGGLLGERIYISSIPATAPLNGFMILFMPIIFAMLFAALGGLIFAFFTVTLKCNHNVTGLTLTTFGVGLSAYFIGLINTDRMGKDVGLAVQSLFSGTWDKNDFFGNVFLSQSFFTYLAIIVAVVAAIILSRTRIGLNLRACGENPAAADAAGINVDLYRYLATIIGAAIAGLGGITFELDVLKGYFNARDAIDAFGWLSLSLVIFSMWKPSVCIGASFIFGALQQIGDYLPSSSNAQKQAFLLLPYVFTIIVLIITSLFNSKNTQPPAGLGVTYFREDR